VTITAADTDVTITVEDGVSNSSNAFDVEPGDLDYFTFDTIPSPQTAGEPFEVTIRAYDGEGNPKTDYAGPANLSDSTDTLDRSTTGSFTDGVWTGDVTITAADTDVTITVEDGVSESSNTFDVEPAALHSIVISPTLATIPAGGIQLYTAEAFDEFDNTRGDVTTDTDFSIEEEAGGTWSENVYTSQNYGTWTVQGTYTGTIVVEGTAALTVLDTDLSFDKDDGRSTVYAGDRLTYTLSYTNSGNETAQNIIITDTLPRSVEYIDCECNDGSCQVMPRNEVVFRIPSLAPETSGYAQMVVKVNDTLPDGVSSVVNVASMGASSLEASIQKQDVNCLAVPDLTVEVDHLPDIFSPGELMTYTLTYGNTGLLTANGVSISTTLPSGTDYVTGCVTDEGWETSDGRTYTCYVGDLNADSIEQMVDFVIRHQDQPEVSATEFDTSFTIDEQEGIGEANAADNTAYARIGVPDLVVTDFNVEPYPLEPDMPVTFTIVVENQGTGTAWNPNIADDWWGASSLDVYIAFVPSYPWVRYSEKDIWDYLPVLDPGEAHTFVITRTGPPDYELIQFSEEEIRQNFQSFYVKVDSFNRYPYGGIPESNEMNNVWPVFGHQVYLPTVARND
jgi:uncharacterized repeat protein (TIGR01451 family)